jgi:hypothetical protein
LISDDRPHLDDCVQTTAGLANANQITMSGKNVGDLLNAKGYYLGLVPRRVRANRYRRGLRRSGARGLRTTSRGLAGDDAVALIVAWGDSDGWYDHQMGTIVTQSNVSDTNCWGLAIAARPKRTM